MFTRPTRRATKQEGARDADSASRVRACAARHSNLASVDVTELSALAALLAECVCVAPSNAQAEAALTANDCRKSPRPEREVSMLWLRAHTRVAPEVCAQALARARRVLVSAGTDTSTDGAERVLAALEPLLDAWARSVAATLIADVEALLRVPAKKRK